VNLPAPDVSGPEFSPASTVGPDSLDGFDSFDAELASALEEIGGRALPHEFDSAAILRRTARGRSCRLLAGSATVLAVAVGAAVLAGGTGGGNPAAAAASGRYAASAAPATAVGTDPLVLPGVFRTLPDGRTAIGYTEYGATGFFGMSGVGTGGYLREVQSTWRSAGVEYAAQVTWFGQSPVLEPGAYAGSPVGTVNGRSAYLSDVPQRQLTFWTGSQGYATLIIFANGVTESSATSEDLLGTARSLSLESTAVPMPVRVSGLGSAVITGAGMGDALASNEGGSWAASLTLEVDGRSYMIDVIPGVAVEPTPTGTETSTGVLAATRTVDGIGITVTTFTDKEGSADAPTVAQVLAHVTALGTDPSGWTTDVLTR
jgi:hypothetical protein